MILRFSQDDIELVCEGLDACAEAIDEQSYIDTQFVKLFRSSPIFTGIVTFIVHPEKASYKLETRVAILVWSNIAISAIDMGGAVTYQCFRIASDKDQSGKTIEEGQKTTSTVQTESGPPEYKDCPAEPSST